MTARRINLVLRTVQVIERRIRATDDGPLERLSVQVREASWKACGHDDGGFDRLTDL